jgi:ribosomal-protein-serine acetyltransferase
MNASLCDGKVRIRCFQVEDAVPLYEAARESIGELCQWMVWCRPGYSLEDSKNFIVTSATSWEKGEQYSFAIIDDQSGVFLGSIGLNRVDRAHLVANLGYWVRRSRTREGIASAATRLVTRFAFQELRLNRVEIIVPTTNHASQRVAAKAAGQLEGILRKRLLLNGKFHDAIIFSLVAED